MKMPKSEHAMVDESMLPGGRSWQHGVRFICTRCKLERRKVKDGRDLFYLRGKRADSNVACIGGVK